MTVPTGPAKLSDIQTEFGGTPSTSLSEYYAGGLYVPNPPPTSVYQTGPIPTSGRISIGNFLGVTKVTDFVFNDVVSTNMNDYNMRNRAIAAGWDQSTKLKATITINSGVVVSSSTTSGYAFQLGAAPPAGSTVLLTNNGVIAGRGGNGGAGGSVYSTIRGDASRGGNGSNGGPGMLIGYGIRIRNLGTIGGGGGGGAGGDPEQAYVGPPGPTPDSGGTLTTENWNDISPTSPIDGIDLGQWIDSDDGGGDDGGGMTNSLPPAPRPLDDDPSTRAEGDPDACAGGGGGGAGASGGSAGPGGTVAGGWPYGATPGGPGGAATSTTGGTGGIRGSNSWAIYAYDGGRGGNLGQNGLVGWNPWQMQSSGQGGRGGVAITGGDNISWEVSYGTICGNVDSWGAWVDVGANRTSLMTRKVVALQTVTSSYSGFGPVWSWNDNNAGFNRPKGENLWVSTIVANPGAPYSVHLYGCIDDWIAQLQINNVTVPYGNQLNRGNPSATNSFTLETGMNVINVLCQNNTGGYPNPANFYFFIRRTSDNLPLSSGFSWFITAPALADEASTDGVITDDVITADKDQK